MYDDPDDGEHAVSDDHVDPMWCCHIDHDNGSCWHVEHHTLKAGDLGGVKMGCNNDLDDREMD